MPLSEKYGISVAGNKVEIDTKGNAWIPAARDPFTIDRIVIALNKMNEVASKIDSNYKVTINVWGVTYKGQLSKFLLDSDGAYPFTGKELKILLDRAINKSNLKSEHILKINVGDKKPSLYGKNSPEILVGKVEDTNEMIELEVSC